MRRHPPPPRVLNAIAEALTIQVERDFAPAWESPPRASRAAAGATRSTSSTARIKPATTAAQTSSTSSSSSSGTSSTDPSTFPQQGTAAHEDAEKAVTGDAATSAQAAAVKSVGSGTAGAVTSDFTGKGYETTVTKSDGSQVEVHLDSSFNVMTRHGPGA